MTRRPVLVLASAVLLIAGCDGSGAARRTTVAESTAPPTSAAPVVVPDGFAAAQARVTGADGQVCELCVWVADTAELRARGLMHVTELGGADAMAFVYPGPTTSSFWMKNTVLPLSIAFFDADGAFLERFDMAPCERDPCPSYATPPGFTIAVEVPQGGLDAFLMQPGSEFALLDLPCDP